LHFDFFIQDKHGQRCPLVFVGHGYGGQVLKQILVKGAHFFQNRFKDNLCGVVFYGATNTKLTNKHGPMLMENEGSPQSLSKNIKSMLDSSRRVCKEDLWMCKSVNDPMLDNLKLESGKDLLMCKSVNDPMLDNLKLESGKDLLMSKSVNDPMLDNLKFESGKDLLMPKSANNWLLEDDLLKLLKRFETDSDLKVVKVCVVDKNKSFLQVCIFYAYSN